MPVYTLIVTDAVGRQYTTVTDFPSDEVAISDAGQFVSAEHPSVAIARDVGEAIDFLGAWDLSDGHPGWTRE
jgi:hypothetical protein